MVCARMTDGDFDDAAAHAPPTFPFRATLADNLASSGQVRIIDKYAFKQSCGLLRSPSILIHIKPQFHSLFFIVELGDTHAIPL
jgi:hypothetical protein